jgi:methionyl aminopeptidase
LSLPAGVLESLREAGRVASVAREAGARLIVPGAAVRDVCEAVEDEITRRGGGLAFPAQSSRNEIAAHYCSSPEDETVYQSGDLAKLDLGVHFDGWVVDTALTVNVGDRPENRPFVEAAREALESAIATAGPGVPVRKVSQAIESTVRRYGLRPMQNLCGHGVSRWTVHCPPAIPNVADGTSDRLLADAVVAVEPFATDGAGEVIERGTAEVFRLDPRRATGGAGVPEVVAAIRAFNGLPFARRQLARFPRAAVEETLRALRAAGQLGAYPPLVEAQQRKVAQAEHTLYLGPDGVEVLTR